ncbi:hypothetical protein F4802DRAFT_549668 [Xylaria palmicola]|nr:hypothetical protein F4802DRAFT_549668 [Xylaria palmicola]
MSFSDQAYGIEQLSNGLGGLVRLLDPDRARRIKALEALLSREGVVIELPSTENLSTLNWMAVVCWLPDYKSSRNTAHLFKRIH